ncbi:TonB-dependent receptor [Altererythrobacter arenosus]|uniref:TonB-dependent receptor n=1 Tax=Altererythrobacter arenosus TaxID=3032592 RepID=A0ABY8FN70_9SPHN|nr:TonB-dependent receptor [Altererythrobacter sp. CAU 1644]WFL76468.1 TonB-dependent receptor [Altererythrobacter sp. CAU 1644]
MRSIKTGVAGSTRFALLAGTAAVAMSLPAVAQAQDEAEDAAEEAAAEDSDDGFGNVIIVTATKREQTLQETPVAVSVTTAETIERAQIRDVADLSSVVPSLTVSQSQSQFATTFSVRGFGTSGNNIGLEPSVAMFVDGVYRSRSIAQISDLPDIQRVEVLRGPQSTLFGKNASAGVISLVTKEPSFDFGGSVEASYGNYDAIVVKGYLTGPLSDNIAASLAGGYNRRDGYVTNLFNGQDVNDRNRWFGRGQVMFDNGEALKVRFIADYDEIDEVCCAAFNLRPSAATGAIQLLGGQVNDFNGVPDADEVYSDVVPFNKIKNWGLSGQIDYDLSDTLTLTSITAYRETKMNADQDVDFTSAALATGANIGQAKLDTFTQELRLASNFDGPVNFLLGGYYFDETVDTADQIIYGSDFRGYVDLLIRDLTGNTQTANSIEATFGAPPNTFWQAGQGFFNAIEQKNEAYSIFGNVDFEFIDGLVLTLGANYTHDKKSIVTDSVSTDLFSSVDIPGAITGLNNFFIAQTVGGLLGLNPPGTLATPAQIAFFQTNFPAGYQQVVAGVNAQTAPLLGFQSLQFLRPFQNCPNSVEDCSFSDDDMSWTVRLAYDITPTLNGYASWSTGYKGASFNLSRDSSPTAADVTALRNAGLAVPNLRAGSRFAFPEESEVWELGLKGNWEYASANLTLFLQKLKNFQDNTFTGTGFILGNAGSRETKGIEFDGRVNPIPQLTLSLAVTYLDSIFENYVGSPLGDVSGQEIPDIPQLRAVFGFQWDQELANFDRLILRADYGYESTQVPDDGLLDYIVRDAAGNPIDFGPAFAAARAFQYEVNNLNASLTYAMDMGLEFTIWGRNILDDRNVTGVFDSVAQTQSISGYTDAPRTYGGTIRYKF